MQNMYGRRLDLNLASVEEDEIMVFATPIERTQQSAAAFLAGMLDRMFKNIRGAYLIASEIIVLFIKQSSKKI